MPDIEDVQECLWKHASLDAGHFQKLHREELEKQERIRADGRVYLTPEPKDMLVFIAGGLGGLHATGFHTFGTSLSQTKPIAWAIPAGEAKAAE